MIGQTQNETVFSLARKNSFTIASNRTLQGGVTDLTISAWLRLDSKTTNEVVAAKDNDATIEGSEYWLGYELYTDRLNFQVEDPEMGTMFVKANAFGSPPIGEWVYVVGWYDRIHQRVSIQVNNGSIDQAPAGSTTRVTDTAFAIGSDANVGSFFDGQIRNVGFFRRLLTYEERAALYGTDGVALTRGYELLPDSLRQESPATFVSWWDLTETRGVRRDSRSTGNDLMPGYEPAE